MSLTHIQVTVSPHNSHGEELLKIIWNYDPEPAPPYFVSTKAIKEKGDKVRSALQHLVDRAMKNHESQGDGDELRELAKAGHELYEALFNEIEGFDASVIKTWLNRKRADEDRKGVQCQITFVAETLLHIPWGLIYDSSPRMLTDLSDQDSMENYKDFWALKFLVCCVYRRILPQWLTVSNYTAGNDVVSVINKPAFDKAASDLLLPQDQVLKWLEDTFGSPLTSSDDFFERWKNSGETCRLLYFYCHGSHESLELHLDDRITITDFRERTRLSDSTSPSTCLVFLNGCNTAAGSEKGTFLAATSERAFCGFVGAETKVPDLFAMRFGLAFLYYFLHEGWPIFKTMDRLRRQHWPLGLVYSSFCSPLLSFTPVDARLKIDITDNFSQLPLRTKRI